MPQLPIDFMFKNVTKNEEIVNYEEYITCLRTDLEEAWWLAQQHATKEQRCHAKAYNRKLKGAPTEVGDLVLLANNSVRLY